MYTCVCKIVYFLYILRRKLKQHVSHILFQTSLMLFILLPFLRFPSLFLSFHFPCYSPIFSHYSLSIICILLFPSLGFLHPPTIDCLLCLLLWFNCVIYSHVKKHSQEVQRRENIQSLSPWVWVSSLMFILSSSNHLPSNFKISLQFSNDSNPIVICIIFLLSILDVSIFQLL